MNQNNTRYFWLSAEQMRRMQPFFLKVRGRARSVDCTVDFKCNNFKVHDQVINYDFFREEDEVGRKSAKTANLERVAAFLIQDTAVLPVRCNRSKRPT